MLTPYYVVMKTTLYLFLYYTTFSENMQEENAKRKSKFPKVSLIEFVSAQ